MRQRDDFDVYYDSLAVAGEDGTLDDRMRGTAAAGNSHAKTGTLNVAVCLSGYVDERQRPPGGVLDPHERRLHGDVGLAKATDGAGRHRGGPGQGALPARRCWRRRRCCAALSLSALEPVHGVGGRLKPVVQP